MRHMQPADAARKCGGAYKSAGLLWPERPRWYTSRQHNDEQSGLFLSSFVLSGFFLTYLFLPAGARPPKNKEEERNCYEQ